MSTASTRSVTFGFTGDVALPPETIPALSNQNSPAQVEYRALQSGDNIIPIPTGAAPTGVTITKPTGNTTLLKLKRQTSDAGLELGLTDVDSFSLNSACTQIVLNAASSVTVRIVWT